MKREYTMPIKSKHEPEQLPSNAEIKSRYGIYCRDETIRLQDMQIAELEQADEDAKHDIEQLIEIQNELLNKDIPVMEKRIKELEKMLEKCLRHLCIIQGFRIGHCGTNTVYCDGSHNKTQIDDLVKAIWDKS